MLGTRQRARSKIRDPLLKLDLHKGLHHRETVRQEKKKICIGRRQHGKEFVLALALGRFRESLLRKLIVKGLSFFRCDNGNVVWGF